MDIEFPKEDRIAAVFSWFVITSQGSNSLLGSIIIMIHLISSQLGRREKCIPEHSNFKLVS